MSTVICENCKISFNKKQKYITAAKKKNRKHFCSLSCVGKYNNQYIIDGSERSKKLPQCQKGYKQKSKKGYKQKNRFGWYVKRATYRKKNNGITTDMLEILWSKQNGQCAISKISLLLHGECKDNRYLASLDRIDSSLPYEEGNIQFIAYPLNLAKSSFNNEDFILFLKEVSANLA